MDGIPLGALFDIVTDNSVPPGAVLDGNVTEVAMPLSEGKLSVPAAELNEKVAVAVCEGDGKLFAGGKCEFEPPPPHPFNIKSEAKIGRISRYFIAPNPTARPTISKVPRALRTLKSVL